MGLLGDIFSTIDSKKRQLKGLLSDPVETIYQGVRNFGEDQRGLLDTMAQASPFIPRTPDQQARIAGFARTPEQARKELADAGAAQGMAAATVWHGSPHKFDKFDSSKIGTGEGAQAYGHGLYLADAQDVARSYAEANSKASLYQGKKLLDANALSDVDKAAAKSIAAQGWDAAVKAAREMRNNGADPVWMDRFEDSLQSFKKAPPRWVNDKAQLYKVDLPDEHIAKMLDWDKPMSQQAPEVKKAIDALKKANPEGYAKLVDMQMGGPLMDQATGRDLYRAIGHDPFSASGIPGIRYLDGGSRGAGTGTSNYVVFPGNEDLLTILERNGQGLLGQ
jgi:hypothetical protein